MNRYIEIGENTMRAIVVLLVFFVSFGCSTSTTLEIYREGAPQSLTKDTKENKFVQKNTSQKIPSFLESLIGSMVLTPANDLPVCVWKRWSGEYFIHHKNNEITLEESLLTIGQVYVLLKKDKTTVDYIQMVDLKRICRDVYRNTFSTMYQKRQFLYLEYYHCIHSNY